MPVAMAVSIELELNADEKVYPETGTASLVSKTGKAVDNLVEEVDEYLYSLGTPNHSPPPPPPTHTHTHLQFSDDGVWHVFLLLLKKVETDRVESVGAQLRVTQENLGGGVHTQLLVQLDCNNNMCMPPDCNEHPSSSKLLRGKHTHKRHM